MLNSLLLVTVTLLSAVEPSTSVNTSARLSTYKNPIISGFAPDPSCIRVDEQYFCVTSSFSVFPGIPVYTSRDLIQWKQIGNVLSRPEQLPTLANVNQTTGGIWAATIRHHEDTFYVTTTLVFDGDLPDAPERWDNMIFSTKNIFAQNGNGWSDPVHFSFDGYDTSLFWDDNGRTYVQGAHSWRVYPAIELFEIDLTSGKSLSGEPVIIWNGTGGLAPEGPHIYKRDDGFYYLLIAEGGTGLNHMVTMARSKDITGPYDPCPYNPVLTNANTTEYLQTVGHADLFQDTAGNWWAVSLATRNATVDYPMGRETVLVPVTWEEGEFPVFNGGKPGRVHIDMRGPLPPKNSPTTFLDTTDPFVGHSQHITFSSAALPRQLVYYRLPDFSLFGSSPPEKPDTLRVMGSAQNISGDFGVGTSSFIMRRQDALEFSMTVEMEFDPRVEGEEAGVSLFLQKSQHFDLGVVALTNSSGDGLRKFIRLKTITAMSARDGSSDPLSQPGIFPLEDEKTTRFELNIQAVNASTYLFSYVEGSRTLEQWEIVGYGDASEVSGGFTGTLIGMYATGNGRNSTSPAYFSNFKYDPVRGVY